LAALVVGIALGGTALFGHVLAVDSLRPTEVAAIALFGLLFGHLACAFLLAVGGFGRGMSAFVDPLRRVEGSGSRPARSRTAIVMVVRHEEIRRVQAGLRATFQSLAASGSLEPFTLFVLSDSTDAAVARDEEQAIRALIRELDAAGRLVYRRRAINEGRKSGNLADFCARWGPNFDYMVVLDADSLLEGRTIRELVRRMDVAPRVGILQVPTRPVNRTSLFGRVQQFAAGVYGPLLTDGLEFWLGPSAPYWGHNAIIRLAPFMKHCRLPRLPGREPFGGEILSHDFVEGALMRRAGWEVRLAADLGGSYEEVPANLIAYAARDRRWCQGNLQHLRLVTLPGLSLASRLTFIVGALAYLCAPAWALFVVLLSLPLRPARIETIAAGAADARWVSATLLLTAVLAFLFLPKALAVIRLARRPGGLRSWGGTRAVVASVLGESVFAALLTPIQLVLHTQFVLAILLRRAVGWTAQPRHDRDTRVTEALQVHGGHTALAVLLSGLAYMSSPSLLLWLAPCVAGLLLSIPISVGSSYSRWGLHARRWGLFLIAEELAPPRMLRSLTASPAESELRAAPYLAELQLTA
jgi:membrane glycosyltransferase